MKEIMDQLQQLYSNNKNLDELEQLGYENIEPDLLQKLLKLHDNKLE